MAHPGPASCGHRPRIRWRVNFRSGFADRRQGSFAALAKRPLPHKRGRRGRPFLKGSSLAGGCGGSARRCHVCGSPCAGPVRTSAACVYALAPHLFERRDLVSVAVVIIGHDTTRYRNVKNLTLLTSIATVAVGLALAPTYARHRGGGWHGGDIHRPLYAGSGFRPEPFYPSSGFHPGPFHPDTGFDPGPFHPGSGFHPGPLQ